MSETKEPIGCNGRGAAEATFSPKNQKTTNPIKRFRLFACCIPVKGARRSVVCDLQRQTFRFIPNGLYEILVEHCNKTLEEIKKNYKHECDREIDEYFEFLVKEEFGFWCDDVSRFPEIDQTWQRPEQIINAIIDVDSQSSHDFASIFHQLDQLGCKALQIRFYYPCSIERLSKILEPTQSGRLRSIDLLLCYDEGIFFKDLEDLCLRHPRISNILIHSAPLEDTSEIKGTGVTIVYAKQAVQSCASCGEVHPAYFVTNVDFFTEAQKFNTCLNRKISIDVQGEIKNCPSSRKSFGNIQTV
ncbi:MAG: grasp-with-spasm system SPASM domain peptide maturase, partial [bacterium]|nr:grasp-with-spasm system SPASM domain peptide maturase [bacterium]